MRYGLCRLRDVFPPRSNVFPAMLLTDRREKHFSRLPLVSTPVFQADWILYIVKLSNLKLQFVGCSNQFKYLLYVITTQNGVCINFFK